MGWGCDVKKEKKKEEDEEEKELEKEDKWVKEEMGREEEEEGRDSLSEKEQTLKMGEDGDEETFFLPAKSSLVPREATGWQGGGGRTFLLII